jgi:hypothetical protein
LISCSRLCCIFTVVADTLLLLPICRSEPHSNTCPRDGVWRTPAP